jgi:2-oxoglutarate ferredoxin oxidoreductase subunit beta
MSIDTSSAQTGKLTRKDFQSKQEVRWCPGCGDYSILAQVQKTLAELDIRRENLAFVSGIGCSSRFPYYLETYGLHSIHGRAPAIAMGLKAARPELSVWVTTGDGDSLSIGTNHLIHALRRNLDINIILFNNRIYGLTKGQYSPTSEYGKRTKSSPLGTIEQPIHPVQIALAAEATFVARTMATDPQHLGKMLAASARHRGAAFVEVLQPCLVFNNSSFGELMDRETRDDYRIVLEDGKPIRFGVDRNKGIRVRDMKAEVVTIGENGVTEDDLLVHDAEAYSPALAAMLANLEPPEFPTVMGIFRSLKKPTYTGLLIDQIEQAKKDRGAGTLDSLLNQGTTWEVGSRD